MTQPPVPTDNRAVERFAEFSLKDAEERLRFQHEYTIAGLKTLILLNGGAVIGLLTYAGNANGAVDPASLKAAFLFYVAGLLTACLAYMTAYASQASFMDYSTLSAIAQLGLQADGMDENDKNGRRGMAFVWAGVVLCLLSLTGFGIGSWYAVSSIAEKHDSAPTLAAAQLLKP